MGKTDPSSETGATVLQEVQVKERGNCGKHWNGPEKQVSHQKFMLFERTIHE